MSEHPVGMAMRFSFPAFVVVAGLVMPGLAFADPAPGKAAAGKHEKAAESLAHMTSKTFGSWTLHCQPPHEEGAEPLCAIAETVQTPSNRLLAVISIGRLHPGDPLNIIVSLPPNVSFPSSVHIRTDKDDKWGLEIQWQRCIPGACIAGGELNVATVAHWSTLQSEGRIVFQDAAGDEVAVPISLRGFGDAYNAFNQ